MFSQWQLLLLVVAMALTDVIAETKLPAFDILPHLGHVEPHRLARRDSPVANNVLLDPNTLYYIQVQVGTPQQNVRMYVSTNSADLIFVGNTSPACSSGACDSFGTYNANASSTYKYQSNYTHAYEYGVQGQGDVVTDQVTVGTSTISNMQFLTTYNANLSAPVLGIGYADLEATSDKYPNLPVQLYNNKYTNIIGYSLHYNHSNATTGGRLIFGGVETNKFYNQLETFPFSPGSNLRYGYTTIQLTSITLYNGNTNSSINNSSMRVVVDSGTPGLRFPPSILQQLTRQIGATLENGYYIYPKSQVSNDTSINLLLGNTTIQIPIYDLWLANNATHLWLSLSEAANDLNIIGIPYFRNAYTVFDLSHNQVSIAPLRHEAYGNNVTSIDVNGAAGLKGYSPVTGTVGSGNGTSSDGSGNSGGQSSSDNDGSSGLSTGAKAGIGVGVAIGALLIIAAAAFIVMRKNRRQRHELDNNNTVQPQRDSYGFKSELPANMHNLNATDHYPYASELPKEPVSPRAEVYGDIRRKPVAPQELP